ncbi:hypothetical protein ACIBEA_39750 [Streptomyces sp. NPDC051555]|uniref:hypothetical protein n=1 Tax=Streptomyces sp. NPDC051555 TaxID=3365657 RepID=UPI0037B3740C
MQVNKDRSTGHEDAAVPPALHGRNTRACAVAYTGVFGWAVTAGHRYRRGGGCTCADTSCGWPGAHPEREPVAALPAHRVGEVFDGRPGAGVICDCALFDAVILPYESGLLVMEELERVAVRAPCMVGDHTTATILALPGTGLAMAGMCAEVRSGTGDWIALPPTKNLRWDTPPTHPLDLPDAAVIRAALEAALGRVRPSADHGLP